MTSKITIPAVKISGSTPTLSTVDEKTTYSLPLLPDASALRPDRCSSLVSSSLSPRHPKKIEDSDSENESVAEEILPMPSTAVLTDKEEDVTNEAELGEFLLDAVEWL